MSANQTCLRRAMFVLTCVKTLNNARYQHATLPLGSRRNLNCVRLFAGRLLRSGDDTALFDGLKREPSTPSCWRKPGPIIPNVCCCATPGPRSRSSPNVVVMGPGLRQDDTVG
ncbi:hypothetical protein chiPu_0029168 [Chiloscyllium punctatum]|uniref:Uncharacterized protein n=1 Tax=Chiloscyllium punctatum TaxID=137246 RepID=A0A401TQK5_CHIPU|nr:hypothetical protein [Chiloscyllium punctatum]